MVRPASALFLLVPLLLEGQTAVLRTLLSRDALTDPAPATLVVLEPTGASELSAGLREVLRQRGVRELQVPLQTLPLDRGRGRELASRLHLGAQARWLLLAPGDAVLAQGTAVPPIANLAQELARAGFRDRVAELRTYLRAHPESLEARERLLAQLRQRAEAAAQAFMGLDHPDPAARPPAERMRAKPLSPAQDLEAWGPFAQALDEAFQSGAWRELDLAFPRNGRPLDAASPTLQFLYRRLQPEVEAALRQEPSSTPLWELWVWMVQMQEGSDPRTFLASLDPPPLASRGEWPPEPVARLLVATARTPDQWRSLQAHFLDRWEGAPHQLLDPPPGGPSLAGSAATADALLDREWASDLSPLLEASLRCGDATRADALVREVWEASRWPSLPARAAAVARRCARADLAARWAALSRGRR